MFLHINFGPAAGAGSKFKILYENEEKKRTSQHQQ